jgi:hypothetical protein
MMAEHKDKIRRQKELKIMKEDQEIEHCTFKPNLQKRYVGGSRP